MHEKIPISHSGDSFLVLGSCLLRKFFPVLEALNSALL